jgi:hypothetical protein
MLRAEAGRDLPEFPTPLALAEQHREVKRYLTEVVIRQGATAPAEALLDEMLVYWQAANELRVQVKDWVNMAAAVGVTVGYGGYDEPQEGVTVEGWIAGLADFRDSLPDIVTAANLQLGRIAAQFHQINDALLTDISEAGERLQQAEVALAQYVATGAVVDAYLLQSGWSQAFDFSPGHGVGTSGYSTWGSGGTVYRTLTHRAFEKGSGRALWGLNPYDLKGKLPRFMPDSVPVTVHVAPLSVDRNTRVVPEPAPARISA